MSGALPIAPVSWWLVLLQLLHLADRTGTDELTVTSHVADAEVRARGLEHVAQLFELSPRAVG